MADKSHFLSSLLLTTALAAGSVAPVQAQVETKTAAGHQFNAKAPRAKLTAAEQEHRTEMNDQLLYAARTNYDDIAAHVNTDYTRTLDALAAEGTAYLQNVKGQTESSVAFIDPFKMDVALAYGIDKYALGEQMVWHMGQNTAKYDMNFLNGTAGGGMLASRTQLGTVTRATTPSAHLPTSGEGTALIVPAQFPVAIDPVYGLTPAQNAEYINRHEMRHCTDTRYEDALKDMGMSNVRYPSDFELHVMLDNPAQMEGFAIAHKMEAQADVGAVGDMIRKGGGIDIIDKVSRHRDLSNANVLHYSPLVLEGLKRKIKQMGVENFRNLGDSAADQLYYEVTEENGLNPARLEAFLKYSKATPAERADMERGRDPDVLKGIEMVKRRSSEATSALRSEFNPFDAQQAEAATAQKRFGAEAKKWDPLKALQDDAFAKEGRITPETLAYAYSRLQMDLSTQMAQQPDKAPLLEDKIARLRESFVTNVKRIDYIAVNAQRGVDLEKTEPALQPLEGHRNVPITGPKAGS